MYTSFEVSPSPDGTENSRIPARAKGIAMRRIHGRHLPNRDLVLSTITPMIRSVTPSNTLDSSMMVPMVAALT